MGAELGVTYSVTRLRHTRDQVITAHLAKAAMKPHPARRRPEPYYKVQYRDPVTLAWKDRRKEAFENQEGARGFLEAQPGALRIVEFSGGRSRTVYERH